MRGGEKKEGGGVGETGEEEEKKSHFRSVAACSCHIEGSASSFPSRDRKYEIISNRRPGGKGNWSRERGHAARQKRLELALVSCSQTPLVGVDSANEIEARMALLDSERLSVRFSFHRWARALLYNQASPAGTFDGKQRRRKGTVCERLEHFLGDREHVRRVCWGGRSGAG